MGWEGTHVGEHMFQAAWFRARAACAIGAGVFCFFGLEVQEELVVGEEG